MSELVEKIQKEMDVWEDLREYGIFEGVEIAKEIIEEHELQHEIKLNSNQQVVLNWLNGNSVKEEYSFMPTGLIFELMNKSNWIDENIIEIWSDELREDQKHQVIVAYLG